MTVLWAFRGSCCRTAAGSSGRLGPLHLDPLAAGLRPPDHLGGPQQPDCTRTGAGANLGPHHPCERPPAWPGINPAAGRALLTTGRSPAARSAVPRPICLCAGQASSYSAGAVWPGGGLAATAWALGAPAEGQPVPGSLRLLLRPRTWQRWVRDPGRSRAPRPHRPLLGTDFCSKGMGPVFESIVVPLEYYSAVKRANVPAMATTWGAENDAERESGRQGHGLYDSVPVKVQERQSHRGWG